MTQETARSVAMVLSVASLALLAWAVYGVVLSIRRRFRRARRIAGHVLLGFVVDSLAVVVIAASAVSPSVDPSQKARALGEAISLGMNGPAPAMLAMTMSLGVIALAPAKTSAHEERRGCCSHHGGVCGCALVAHALKCCDGDLSSTCGC